MPHIYVEYSANLEGAVRPQAVVDAVHAAALSTGLFEVPAVRTRAVRHDVYRVADGQPENAFLHVVARIREGRSAEQRKQLAEAIMAALNAQLDPVFAARPLAATVEIHEITQLTLRRNTIREPAGAAVQ